MWKHKIHVPNHQPEFVLPKRTHQKCLHFTRTPWPRRQTSAERQGHACSGS